MTFLLGTFIGLITKDHIEYQNYESRYRREYNEDE